MKYSPEFMGWIIDCTWITMVWDLFLYHTWLKLLVLRYRKWELILHDVLNISVLFTIVFCCIKHQCFDYHCFSYCVLVSFIGRLNWLLAEDMVFLRMNIFSIINNHHKMTSQTVDKHCNMSCKECHCQVWRVINALCIYRSCHIML